MKSDPHNNNILYFDGVCNLCNGFVNFLIARDKKGRLRFASLQGQTAADNIDAEELEQLGTVIFQQDAKTYRESAASLRAIASLGGIWKTMLIFLLVPKFIRDRVYRYVAANRYKWFGKKDECRMPTPAERNKILA